METQVKINQNLSLSQTNQQRGEGAAETTRGQKIMEGGLIRSLTPPDRSHSAGSGEAATCAGTGKKASDKEALTSGEAPKKVKPVTKTGDRGSSSIAAITAAKAGQTGWASASMGPTSSIASGGACTKGPWASAYNAEEPAKKQRRGEGVADGAEDGVAKTLIAKLAKAVKSLTLLIKQHPNTQKNIKEQATLVGNLLRVWGKRSRW